MALLSKTHLKGDMNPQISMGFPAHCLEPIEKSLANKIFSPTTQFPKETKKMAFFAGNYALKALGFLCGCA